MSRFIDLTGHRFGRLTIVRRAENYVSPNGTSYASFICKCDCGKTVVVRSHDLRTGRTTSCGCYHDQCCRERRTVHSMSRSPLNEIWSAMKQRCSNKNSKDYKNYGGRGISVCEEWEKDFTVFYEWSVKSGYKKGLSIDRIDVNGDYRPDNCRWVTQRVQSNNMRKNRVIEYNGERHTVSEWSEITGIKYRTILQRANSGWDAERILTEPVKTGKN